MSVRKPTYPSSPPASTAAAVRPTELATPSTASVGGPVELGTPPPPTVAAGGPVELSPDAGRRGLPLVERLRDPGFTPRRREVGGLVDLLEDEDRAKAAERAIARAGPAALPILRARFETARPPLRARLLRAIGRLAPPSEDAGGARAEDPGARAEVVAVLLAALDDDDPKTRRNAAVALGHVPGDDIEAALLRAWTRDHRPEMRRSLAASLGKIGSTRALGVLRPAADDADPELARIAARAVLIVERTASRAEGTLPIDLSRAPADPVPVRLLARAGLEELLRDEISTNRALDDAGIEDSPAGGRVSARLHGPLRAIFEARIMLEVRFPLAPEPIAPGEHLADAVARALGTPRSRTVLRTWAPDGMRYRIAWADGVHRRGVTWELVRRLAVLAPDLVNDPTASPWEVLITPSATSVAIELVPRAVRDPRFEWRRADVPAASHPTIAAALARLGGALPDDVVWDPFVGSGAELVERARLGPHRRLTGTDIDARALAAARANLAAAGVEASLEEGDALAYAPRGALSLILTNPPMGRRASREAGLAERLDRFVERAAALLGPGGRLVWIAPWPHRARAAARRGGLSLTWAATIDMGGFAAEMQRWVKEPAGRSSRPDAAGRVAPRSR